MARLLLITTDHRLEEMVRALAGEHGWKLARLTAVPDSGEPEIACDLVLLDCRPAPDSRLVFSRSMQIMLQKTTPIRAARALILSHHEELLGRMNSFVFGGSSYLRIHAYADPPEPVLAQRLKDAIEDTLRLPAYEIRDFHDAFPNRDVYRDAMESIQVPIVILASNGRIKLMNLRALARFNYITQLVIDQDWSMLVAPGDRGQHTDDFLMRISSGYFYEGTLRLVDRLGHEFPALISSSRVFSSQPETDLMIILSIQDLSETEALQRQLNAFHRMESVERVVAGMTHEFNNMLTAILGHAELLVEDLPAGSEAGESASVIRQESERAKDLTNRLLGLSSSRQFVPGPVSCGEIVRETVALLRHSLGSAIQLEMELLEADDWVQGEADQLRQVLVNLCLNARDAISGQGTIHIRTSLREVMPEECRLRQDWTPGFFVEIAVRDTGCGIAADELERVFEPFYTTKAAGAGTGLGLSVVRGMVRNHDGHLAIESAPGEGTTVMVRLPQTRPPVEPPDTGPASPASVRAEEKAEGELVLVIDDDRAVLTFAHKVLERGGYRVCLATTGELGLAQFERYRDEVRLIILDMTMPTMNGREVLHRIRDADQDIRVILCTGFAPGGMDEDLVSQVQGFLRKPYRPGELLGQVREILDD